MKPPSGMRAVFWFWECFRAGFAIGLICVIVVWGASNVGVLKVMSLTVGFSLVIAAGLTLIVGLLLDPLERLRLRWVAREQEGADHVRLRR